MADIPDSEQITIDLARKCSCDVSAAIQRTLALCPDQQSAASVAISGVLASLTIGAGVIDGISGQPVGTTSLRDVATATLDYFDEVKAELAHRKAG